MGRKDEEINNFIDYGNGGFFGPKFICCGCVSDWNVSTRGN
jgi:hypothetical protein